MAAELEETFLACLNDEEFRKQMRRVLIAKYFVDFAERTALYQLVGLASLGQPLNRISELTTRNGVNDSFQVW